MSIYAKALQLSPYVIVREIPVPPKPPVITPKKGRIEQNISHPKHWVNEKLLQNFNLVEYDEEPKVIRPKILLDPKIISYKELNSQNIIRRPRRVFSMPPRGGLRLSRGYEEPSYPRPDKDANRKTQTEKPSAIKSGNSFTDSQNPSRNPRPRTSDSNTAFSFEYQEEVKKAESVNRPANQNAVEKRQRDAQDDITRRTKHAPKNTSFTSADLFQTKQSADKWHRVNKLSKRVGVSRSNGTVRSRLYSESTILDSPSRGPTFKQNASSNEAEYFGDWIGEDMEWRNHLNLVKNKSLDVHRKQSQATSLNLISHSKVDQAHSPRRSPEKKIWKKEDTSDIFIREPTVTSMRKPKEVTLHISEKSPEKPKSFRVQSPTVSFGKSQKVIPSGISIKNRSEVGVHISDKSKKNPKSYSVQSFNKAGQSSSPFRVFTISSPWRTFNSIPKRTLPIENVSKRDLRDNKTPQERKMNVFNQINENISVAEEVNQTLELKNKQNENGKSDIPSFREQIVDFTSKENRPIPQKFTCAEVLPKPRTGTKKRCRIVSSPTRQRSRTTNTGATKSSGKSSPEPVFSPKPSREAFRDVPGETPDRRKESSMPDKYNLDKNVDEGDAKLKAVPNKPRTNSMRWYKVPSTIQKVPERVKEKNEFPNKTREKTPSLKAVPIKPRSKSLPNRSMTSEKQGEENIGISPEKETKEGTDMSSDITNQEDPKPNNEKYFGKEATTTAPPNNRKSRALKSSSVSSQFVEMFTSCWCKLAIKRLTSPSSFEMKQSELNQYFNRSKSSIDVKRLTSPSKFETKLSAFNSYIETSPSPILCSNQNFFCGIQ